MPQRMKEIIINKMVEELISTEVAVESQPQIKFRLGKIKNKHLIIDLYTWAYQSREEALYRMFMHDRKTRELLIEQYSFSSF